MNVLAIKTSVMCESCWKGWIFNMSMAETEVFCDGCVLGKAFWKPFTQWPDPSQVVGQLIHADNSGTNSVNSVQVAKHYVCFKDDYSKYRTVCSSSKRMNFPSVYVRPK
jgi:hypothetical protein